MQASALSNSKDRLQKISSSELKQDQPGIITIKKETIAVDNESSEHMQTEDY